MRGEEGGGWREGERRGEEREGRGGWGGGCLVLPLESRPLRPRVQPLELQLLRVRRLPRLLAPHRPRALRLRAARQHQRLRQLRPHVVELHLHPAIEVRERLRVVRRARNPDARVVGQAQLGDEAEHVAPPLVREGAKGAVLPHPTVRAQRQAQLAAQAPLPLRRARRRRSAAATPTATRRARGRGARRLQAVPAERLLVGRGPQRREVRLEGL